MIRDGERTLLVMLFLAACCSLGHAQERGVLSRRGAISISGESASMESIARLLFNPELSGFARASSWAFSLLAFQEKGEAKLQANLCEVIACKGRHAVHFLLAGPVNSKTGFTELADLDGLIGSTRAELGGTYGLLSEVGLSPKLTLARQTFDYIDPASLAARSDEHWSHSIGLGLSWKPVAKTQLTLSARREGLHKAAGQPQGVCRPATFGPPGTSACQNVVVGAPTEREPNIFEFEVAQNLGKVAFRLKLAYDSDVVAATLPLYVIPNTQGNLSGGVKLGYRSDEDRPHVTFFVNAFEF
jgi:hypothetical protein